MKFLNYGAKEGDIIVYRFNIDPSRKINVSVWKICKNKIPGRLENRNLIGFYDVVVKLSSRKIEYKIENASYFDCNWINKPIKDLDQKILGEEFELNTSIMAGDRMELKKMEPDDYIGKLFIWMKGFKTLIEYKNE